MARTYNRYDLRGRTRDANDGDAAFDQAWKNYVAAAKAKFGFHENGFLDGKVLHHIPESIGLWFSHVEHRPEEHAHAAMDALRHSKFQVLTRASPADEQSLKHRAHARHALLGDRHEGNPDRELVQLLQQKHREFEAAWRTYVEWLHDIDKEATTAHNHHDAQEVDRVHKRLAKSFHALTPRLLWRR